MLRIRTEQHHFVSLQLYKQWTTDSNDNKEDDATKEKARQGFVHQANPDSEWVRF